MSDGEPVNGTPNEKEIEAQQKGQCDQESRTEKINREEIAQDSRAARRKRRAGKSAAEVAKS